MKNFKYIMVIGLLTVFTTSCEKFLDTKPTDTLSPDYYYTTETQMNAALTGVYDVLGNEALYGNSIFTTLNAPTDLSYYRRNNVFSGVQVLNFDASAPEIRQMWQTLYTGINRANLVLANIQKPQMDDAKRDIIKGQALFLRAYYHFLLVSNWGDVPLVLDANVDVNKPNVARTPAKEVYAQILKDMEEAEGLVQDIKTLGFGGRVSKSAVRGILARVNLYMAGAPLNDVSRYPEALKWALAVKNDAVASHQLNPNYNQVFINYAQDKYDTKESIWEVELWGNRIGNNYQEAGRVGNTNGIQCGSTTEGYSYGFIGATAKLYKLYESTDNRRDWAIGPYSYSGQTATKVNWATTDVYQRMCGKFRREYELIEKQKNYTPQNFPLLRYSDVLLMIAEASGPNQVGYDALNEVRRRANAKEFTIANGNYTTNPADYLKIIQDERARELCFEALRVNDLKRWGLYIFNMQQVAADITANAPAAFKYAALAGNNIDQRHLLYPVPLREISINPLLSQNKNW
nr:RagB/SusD family nutrient uptake outer membrane protein [uncultured Pedobacter sp.]